MHKNIFNQILKEEIGKLIEQGQLSPNDIADIVDLLAGKLDSIDLSLDLIYGAISGADPLVTRRKQAAFGRLVDPRPQIQKVASEAQLSALIQGEIRDILEEAKLNKAQLDRQLELHTKEVEKLVNAITAEKDPKKRKQLLKQLKRADKREEKIAKLLKKMDRQLEPAEKKDLYSRLKNSDSKIARFLGKASAIAFPDIAASYGEKEPIGSGPLSDKAQAYKDALAARGKEEPGEEVPGKEEPGEAPEEAAKTDEPVSLFTGQGALFQRLYSSLAAAAGAKSQKDKNDVEWVVKLIMKDLSAQLRQNKIKVQENQLIEAMAHVLTEIVRAPGAAAQSMEAYKAKFKEIEKLRKKYKDDPKRLRTLDMDEEAMKNAYAEFKKSYKPGGSSTDTVKSQKRVTPEKGVLHVGKAAGNKLKHWKGGVLDQETITKLIVKKLKPFIAKALKDRGREDIKIRESKYLDLIVEVIINEMQNTQ